MEICIKLYKEIGEGNSKDVLDAVMHNDCKYVLNYVLDGGDIFIKATKQETLLHKACRNNYFEMVDLLIRLHLDVNAQNNYHETPLHLAVQCKNSDIVQKLLFEKTNVNAQTKTQISPLHIAASRGQIDILNILIDHGAKLNIADSNGAKPIHYAVKSGKKEILRTLLNSGASLMECDDRRNNVLHYACESGDEELIAYVLRHTTINDTRNIYQETPLHFAAINATPKGLKLLLHAGYHLEAKDENGFTPIDVAKAHQKYENLDFLKQYKESIEYKDYMVNYPAHYHARNQNYLGVIQALNKANLQTFDCFGRSILYYSILNRNHKLATYLCEEGSDINKIDEFNQSALLIAVYVEDVDLVSYLITKGANVNEEFYGRTYLYRAILRNNYYLAKLLIEKGANLSYIDSKHRTIFSYALEYADEDMIELLSAQHVGFV